MRIVVLALLSAASACVTPRVDDPPLSVSIAVSGLRQDEREYLTEQICALEGVRECSLVVPPPPERPKGKKARKQPPPPPSEAKIVFQFRGMLGVLRHRIASLPHPGLEPQKADVALAYRGFDNLAPSIEILEPKEGFTTNASNIDVAARVPDIDTASVEISDDDAQREGDTYRAQVNVRNGENAIVVKAVDHAGNAREATVKVIVDQEPPDLEVEVQIIAYDKALVKGRMKDGETVTVDGREVPVDLFGAFQKEVAVDPDKSYSEIVAVDALGNEKRIKRSVKVASPMSGN